MPPINTTLTEDAIDLIEQLNRSHKDLKDSKIPRLLSFKGTLAGQQQHATEVRENMERFSQQLQSLELLIDDQPRKRLQEQLASQVDEYKKTFEQLRIDSRVALLTSKRTLDTLSQSNREELFRSSTLKEKRFDEKQSSGSLMDTSNNVTEALQRTIGLMQGELERSVLSVQMLEESSANLRSATTVHDTIGILLDTSKQLVVSLQRADWMDRLLIFGALLFFFLVCLFILKQRVLDKTFRAAFWWTRFLPNFSKADRVSLVDSVPTLLPTSIDSSEAASLEDAPTTLLSSVTETLIPSLSISMREEL